MTDVLSGGTEPQVEDQRWEPFLPPSFCGWWKMMQRWGQRDSRETTLVLCCPCVGLADSSQEELRLPCFCP